MSGISEDSSKNKRRRPRLLDSSQDMEVHRMHGNFRTPRIMQNLDYETRAFSTLQASEGKSLDDLKWLANRKVKLRRGKSKRGILKDSILSELGRIDDPESMRSIARQVCELKPKTRDAITLIRQWRTGKRKQGSIATLTDEIARCVDSYRLRYPDMKLSEIKDAIGRFTVLLGL